MLPTFLVIGAAKSGTTSLYRYLGAHPDVFMPHLKEPDFFLTYGNWHRGLDWYRGLFADGEKAIAAGEASVGYSGVPMDLGLPERIRSTLPEVKLIYLVRDPIARIRSHYLQDVYSRQESRPLRDVLRNNPFYVNVCRYGTVLANYRRVFPADRFLVLPSEELRDSRDLALAKVFGFIGVSSDWSDESYAREFNKAGRARPTRQGVEKARQNPLYRRASSLVPMELKRAVDRRTALLRVSPAKEANLSLSDRDVEWLQRELAADLVPLKDFLGPDFDCWGLT